MVSSKFWDIEKVKEYISTGLNYQQIADIYGCNSGTVWHFCKKHQLCDRERTKRTHIDNAVILKIKELANNGLVSFQISKELNISNNAVTKAIKDYNIDCKKITNKSCQDYLDDMVKDFESGTSIRQISKKYGFSDSVVLKHLSRKGIDTRKNLLKYSVDETFFDKIDTEEKAYTFGWFMSDGNVSDKGKMRIQIHHHDRDVLEKVRIAMKFSGELKEIPARNTSQPQVCLNIDRQSLAKKLIELGCPTNKSLILDFPTCVPQELLHHFVRGYFDGDGSFSITKYGKYASVTSNDKFNIKFKDILQKLQIESYYYYRYPDKPTCTLFIGKRDSLLKFINWLYKDATIWMERKRNKIKHLESITCETNDLAGV